MHLTQIILTNMVDWLQNKCYCNSSSRAESKVFDHCPNDCCTDSRKSI